MLNKMKQMLIKAKDAVVNAYEAVKKKLVNFKEKAMALLFPKDPVKQIGIELGNGIVGVATVAGDLANTAVSAAHTLSEAGQGAYHATQSAYQNSLAQQAHELEDERANVRHTLRSENEATQAWANLESFKKYGTDTLSNAATTLSNTGYAAGHLSLAGWHTTRVLLENGVPLVANVASGASTVASEAFSVASVKALKAVREYYYGSSQDSGLQIVDPNGILDGVQSKVQQEQAISIAPLLFKPMDASRLQSLVVPQQPAATQEELAAELRNSIAAA